MKTNFSPFSFSIRTILFITLTVALAGCASAPPPNAVVDPCLKRRGAIDIGSGSTKAYAAIVDICSSPKRIVEKLFDEKVKISFAEALEQNSEGLIPQDVITDASAKIATLAERMNALNLESIWAVATAAIRNSKNGEEVAIRISNAMNERLRGKTKLELKVQILSQVAEAQVGVWSALANVPLVGEKSPVASPVAVWDIGGGSMQLTALPSGSFFAGDLASVTFKNRVIKEIQKKDPSVLKSPNPLKKDFRKAVALARAHAEKKLGALLKVHTTKPRWIGIGGVLSLSVQKQIDREVPAPRQKSDSAGRTSNHFTQADLATTLDKRANRTDEEIDSEYRETEITNLALVLGYMQALKMEKIETVEASLVQGLTLP